MRWTKLASAGVIGLGLMCGTIEAVRPASGPNRGPSPVPRPVIDTVPAPVSGPVAQPPIVSRGTPVVEPKSTGPAQSRPALPVEPIPGAVATWRAGVYSQDAAERAGAVDAIPFCPEHDGIATLEKMMTSDPDAWVRERAVTAYTQAVGRKGVATLRKVALGEENEEVASAARASLALIDKLDPLPARGELTVTCEPSSFSKGDWLTVRARFQADEDAPEARLVLSLPKAWEADGRGNEWEGPLWKGVPQEAVFAVKVGGDASSAKLSGRLKIDFAEELDVEVVSAVLPLALEGGAGRFLGATSVAPADRTRTIVLTSEGEAE